MSTELATAKIVTNAQARMDAAKKKLIKHANDFVAASSPGRAELENLKSAVRECELAWHARSI